MNTPQKEQIEALTDLVKQAQSVDRVGDGAPFVILPSNHTVVCVEEHALQPARKRGTVCLHDPASFTRFVNEQRDRDSRIYFDGHAFTAVLNHPGKDPAWADFRASYALKQAPQWVGWAGNSKRMMTQKDFAQFIEDNLTDIVKPEGGALLDMVRDLEATNTVVFKGATRLQDGTQSLAYEQTTSTKAGQKGALELPNEFTLLIPAFANSVSQRMDARLRFKITEDAKLVLWYELLKVPQALQAYTDAVVQEIFEDTQIEPFYGTPLAV